MKKNEKTKKTLEKLHMILDNPSQEAADVEDEKHLDTLRERLTKPYKKSTVSIRTGDARGPLQPQVTIHHKEKPVPSLPEMKPVEPEEPKKDIFYDEDLFEVKKVKPKEVEFLEVKPKEETPEFPEEVRPEPSEEIAEKEMEELPEWEPVEIQPEEEIAEEKPEPEEKLPVLLEEEKADIHGEVPAEIFKDIPSIDEKTASLLYKNGVTSVERLQQMSVKDLKKIRGIRGKLAKQIKKEVGILTAKEEELPEWKIYDEEEVPEEKPGEGGGYIHKGYTLYRKEIKTGSSQTRTIHFFSKAKPEDGEPVQLPKGFEVKVNRKTGVPYLKKKK